MKGLLNNRGLAVLLTRREELSRRAERLIGEYHVLSKYKGEWWFVQALAGDKTWMMSRAYALVREIGVLEVELAQCDVEIAAHMAARQRVFEEGITFEEAMQGGHDWMQGSLF